MKHSIQTETDLETLVESWLKQVGTRDLILLKGPMGVGKTRFVRAAVEKLGGKWVSSPSFAVIQRYPAKPIAVDHVDLFRLKNSADIDSTGFWDLFEQTQARVFVEWPERVPDEHWPRNFSIWKIDILFEGGGRSVEIQKFR